MNPKWDYLSIECNFQLNTTENMIFSIFLGKTQVLPQLWPILWHRVLNHMHYNDINMILFGNILDSFNRLYILYHWIAFHGVGPQQLFPSQLNAGKEFSITDDIYHHILHILTNNRYIVNIRCDLFTQSDDPYMR